jgi:hypothetical protein
MRVFFEVLHLTFVLFCLLARLKRTQVPPLSGLGIDLPRIEPVLAGLELSDHVRAPKLHSE